MERKELLFKALRHEPITETPWVPFAGVHAGVLKGYTAEEVLKDGDKLFESLMEVNKLYKPHGQPVVFDLQLEAECMGCDLHWAPDGPPSVASHPLDGDEDEAPEIPDDSLIPTPESGRIPMVLDVMRRMKAAVGDTTALYGLICGPFTLASHLRGNNIFTDMFDFEDETKELLAFTTKVAKAMSDYMIDAGMDVIAVVDPLISQISVNHFEEFMSEPFTDLFDHIHEKGAFSSFFVCGDASRNIESMCKTHCDAISIDENVDLVATKKNITDKYNVVIGGNVPLTTVMLHGNQQDNMKWAIEMMDKVEDKTNFILAPGCDMPYATPVENAIGIAEAVSNPDSVREMVANYVAVDEDIDVELPDYEHLSKPLVEVFTLDSTSCAACTYMMGAANQAKETYGDKIDMVEYKFTLKENIARCKKMGVKNLPSMYINGQLKFSSIIPTKQELEDAINAVM